MQVGNYVQIKLRAELKLDLAPEWKKWTMFTKILKNFVILRFYIIRIFKKFSTLPLVQYCHCVFRRITIPWQNLSFVDISIAKNLQIRIFLKTYFEYPYEINSSVIFSTNFHVASSTSTDWFNYQAIRFSPFATYKWHVRNDLHSYENAGCG